MESKEKTQKIEERFNNPTLNLALDTLKIGKQALIFVNTKPSAEKTAEEIAGKVQISEKALLDEYDAISEKARRSLSRPTKQCERLARCLKKGVAFHHAGLTQKQKDMIEQGFKDKKIKIIAATPTLAAGVDLPAFRAIIRDLKRFGQRGMQPIPVLEFMQMAGRAGRPKYDTWGEAICIAGSESEKDQIFEYYIMGEPEDITSKLAVEPVLRTYLLSLIAGNFVRTRKQIMDFFSSTFWAHQYQDMDRLEAIIQKMLNLLIGFGFLTSTRSATNSDFLSADEISEERYTATPIGNRVAELYLDPLTANGFITSMKRAKLVQIIPFSLLHMVSYTLEIRPLLRVKVKEYEAVQQKIAEFESNMVVLEPSAFDPDYDDFLNSVKTAMFFSDWIDEDDEEELLEKYSIRPGEVRAKTDVADWLLYSCIELAKLLDFRELTKEMAKLRLRLKYGVREELLPLLRLKGIGRVRARALFRNGLKTISDMKDADVSAIGTIIHSTKIAQDIKDQLGQKVEKISKNKRKGQKGLS